MNNSLQLCSFEQAKLLKELRFNWPCRNSIEYSDTLDTNVEYQNGVLNTNSELEELNRINKPTIQLALKWLRDVHWLEINIEWFSTEEGGDVKYDYRLGKIGECHPLSLAAIYIECYNADRNFDTYEEAESAALDFALEYLKENKYDI